MFLPQNWLVFFDLKFLRLGPSAAGKSTLLPQMQVGFISRKKGGHMVKSGRLNSKHMKFIHMYIYIYDVEIDSSGVDFSCFFGSLIADISYRCKTDINKKSGDA